MPRKFLTFNSVIYTSYHFPPFLPREPKFICVTLTPSINFPYTFKDKISPLDCIEVQESTGHCVNKLTDMNAKSKKLVDVTSNSYLLNHPLSIEISLETKVTKHFTLSS